MSHLMILSFDIISLIIEKSIKAFLCLKNRVFNKLLNNEYCGFKLKQKELSRMNFLNLNLKLIIKKLDFSFEKLIEQKTQMINRVRFNLLMCAE